MECMRIDVNDIMADHIKVLNLSTGKYLERCTTAVEKENSLGWYDETCPNPCQSCNQLTTKRYRARVKLVYDPIM